MKLYQEGELSKRKKMFFQEFSSYSKAKLRKIYTLVLNIWNWKFLHFLD